MTQLTPDQITQIERHLAELVCGWKLGCLGSSYFLGEEMQIRVAEWHPLSNPSQAAMVREKMRERRCIYKLEARLTGETPFWASFIPISDWNFLKIFSEGVWFAPTESEASGVAAALATGFKL